VRDVSEAYDLKMFSFMFKEIRPRNNLSWLDQIISRPRTFSMSMKCFFFKVKFRTQEQKYKNLYLSQER